MIRVCHIISGDLWAGAEVMAFYLLKGLTKYRDLELSVIVLNERRFAEEIRGLGIPLEVVDESKMPFFKILLVVRKMLNCGSPDVIHSHRYKENILAYLVSRSKKGTKLIGTQHGMPEGYRGKRSLKNQLITNFNFYLLSRCFQNVVAVSNDIQETFLNQYGFSFKNKVRVIHNGIGIPENILARREKDTFVIGSSGRLFPVKDYLLMIEVAREVSKKTGHIRFELAGDGPERVKIQDLIKKYRLDGRFMLRGFVSDISPFYRGLDLYLNTSVNEGIPISVLEAMAHGLPVIAPKVGGLAEIVTDSVDGFLVEGRNPKDFAEKCIQLFGDETLRKQMALAAREKVIREFSVDQMVGQYYRLYRDVVGM